jgi:hypothetical protein
MKKIGFIMFAALVAVACNNSANSTKTTDSTAVKDNTNMYDTGTGSSMTDTSRRMDTSRLPNKMQDTGMKKK